ncbi:FAD/NAD(P)-binding domain-containing protein [Epithele typhae]|uniref:FAD/NAD(P)-binding domain-containing protein n=1 Tax=Epithele typhae TaxID=378194 RepID=UPI0020076B44|nr:FAD/NAD(P)-binding domain-containing protein [Epithele typhae]KAH9926277.1 FAD/NAD(P)-binding domain-containing protein [Epithele typhae]
MGGLVLALALQQRCSQHTITIYESTAALSTVGAGIGMVARVWDVLRALGLEDELLAVTGAGNSASAEIFYSAAAKSLTIIARRSVRTFHRGDVQKVIVNHLNDIDSVIQYSKRLVSYDEPASLGEPITLHFRDGTTAACDLLVGSDGIRSAVRRAMYERLAGEAEKTSLDRAQELRKVAEPVWSGLVAYRGLIPAERVPAEDVEDVSKMTIRLGKNKIVVSYPVMGGKMFNLAAFVGTSDDAGTLYDGEWSRPATVEEAYANFEKWDPLILRIMKGLNSPILWAIHKTRELPTYAHGRVAIVGDAAHAMMPFQAAGAGQAIEDGFVLSEVLAHPSVTARTLPAALAAYDTVRRPFAHAVQRASDETTETYQLRRAGWEGVTVEESAAGGFAAGRLAAVAEKIYGMSDWALRSGIMDDSRDVRELLRVLQEVNAH